MLIARSLKKARGSAGYAEKAENTRPTPCKVWFQINVTQKIAICVLASLWARAVESAYYSCDWSGEVVMFGSTGLMGERLHTSLHVLPDDKLNQVNASHDTIEEFQPLPTP